MRTGILIVVKREDQLTLNIFGLIVEKTGEDVVEEGIYLFTEKMYRFRYWLMYNEKLPTGPTLTYVARK